MRVRSSLMFLWRQGIINNRKGKKENGVYQELRRNNSGSDNNRADRFFYYKKTYKGQEKRQVGLRLRLRLRKLRYGGYLQKARKKRK